MTQHLKSRANGDSADPRVREPVFPILRKTTTEDGRPDHQEEPRGAENGITTAETRRPINGAPSGVRQQTPCSEREVRFPETRVNRGAVHAAVGTAMAELGEAPDNRSRDYVDGQRSGRIREISACASRARTNPQRCTSSNPMAIDATSWADHYHHPVRE